MRTGSDNVTEQIMKYIKEKIVIGKWPVGTKIPSENELCRKLGYSRTSVRSAIQKYNVLGVLESQQGRGTFVKSMDLFLPKTGIYSDLFGNPRTEAGVEFFKEWRQVRSLLEPQIVYRAAKEATPQLVEKLKRINQEQFDAIGNQQEFIKKDVEFHMAIASFLENEILDNIMKYLFSMQEMLVFSNEEFGYSGGGYFHMLITDAIEQHDAEGARDLMQEHQSELSRLFITDSQIPSEG